MSDEPDVPEPETSEPEPFEATVPAGEERALSDAQARRQAALDHDATLDREVRRLSRRGFLTAAVAAGAGLGGWKWLTTRQSSQSLQWPLRRALQANESLAEAYFSQRRLSPLFPPSQITRPARLNGNLGLDPDFDPRAWHLRVEGGPAPLSLTLDDIKAFPRREQITEFRCIEGWSTIVKWTGTRLSDLIEKYPPRPGTAYVAMETPDRGYYVGLDMQSAMHPQTLLAYSLNDEPLTPAHGAPLRLAIPVKYGIKNIKRIGLIRYSSIRPVDFWAERGYDWYAGL